LRKAPPFLYRGRILRLFRQQAALKSLSSIVGNAPQGLMFRLI